MIIIGDLLVARLESRSISNKKKRTLLNTDKKNAILLDIKDHHRHPHKLDPAILILHKEVHEETNSIIKSIDLKKNTINPNINTKYIIMGTINQIWKKKDTKIQSIIEKRRNMNLKILQHPISIENINKEDIAEKITKRAIKIRIIQSSLINLDNISHILLLRTNKASLFQKLCTPTANKDIPILRNPSSNPSKRIFRRSI